MRYSPKIPIKLLLLYAMTLWAIPPCPAEENELQQGLQEYKRHEWDEALSHLGAALPSEFNNANLHYHMANCMVHMRQKESAIREYRIAYALDPQGRIGNYSKMCLHLFGIDAAGFLPMPEAPAKIETKGKEIDTLAKKDSRDAKDAKDSRDAKDSGLAKVAKYVTEEDLVRQNLQDLMQSKHRPGSAKLQEIGTNVFVRNYKEPTRIGETIADNKSSNKSDNKSSNKPDNKSSNKPDNKSSNKPDNKSSNKPDNKSSSKSDNKFTGNADSKSASKPGQPVTPDKQHEKKGK